MISVADARSPRGLSRMKIVPVLPPRVSLPRLPQLDMKPSTPGSWATTAATSFWCSTIDSKEMPWAASVGAKIWPVSSVGRKPFGTWTNSHIVATRTSAENTSVPRW